MLGRICVALVMLTAVVRAQPSTAIAQAEVLFRQGKDQMAAGKVAEACASFDASQRLAPSVSTRLNQANCREKNGQLATAWGYYLDASREAAALGTPDGKQLRQTAGDKAAKLEARVSSLKITVAGDRKLPGLEVLRDGEVLDPAMWNAKLPMDGGTYNITARAPGRGDWMKSVTIGNEKDAQTVEIPLLEPKSNAPITATPGRPAPAPAPRPAPAPAPTTVTTAPRPLPQPAPAPAPPPHTGPPATSPQVSTRPVMGPQPRPEGGAAPATAMQPAPAPQPTIGPPVNPGGQTQVGSGEPQSRMAQLFAGRRKFALAAGGAAVVTFAIGAALGATATSNQHDADKLCPSQQLPCADADEANRLSKRAHSQATKANVAFGLSAVAAIGAAVLWFTAEPTEPRRVTIAPQVSPSSAGIAITGGF